MDMYGHMLPRSDPCSSCCAVQTNLVEARQNLMALVEGERPAEQEQAEQGGGQELEVAAAATGQGQGQLGGAQLGQEYDDLDDDELMQMHAEAMMVRACLPWHVDAVDLSGQRAARLLLMLQRCPATAPDALHPAVAGHRVRLHAQLAYEQLPAPLPPFATKAGAARGSTPPAAHTPP